MVSKVTISSFRQFIQRNPPSAKTTKIALAALGFLVLVLIGILYRRKEALPKTPLFQDPKTGFDPRILKLIGGLRGLDKLSRIKPPDRKEGEVSASEKEQAIVKDNINIRYPPVRWGHDAWGCLFIWVSFVHKASQGPLFSLIYANMESGQLRWYLNKVELSETDDHYQILKRVIAKNDNRYELAKPVKSMKAPSIVDEIFLTLDPELLEILGGVDWIKIPIKYLPKAVIDKDKVFRQDLVSSDQKLAAIHQIVVKETFIFRGIDDWGLPFVVIRYVEKENFRPHILCFYQNEEKDGTVLYFNEIKFYGRLLERDSILPSGSREILVNHSARSLIHDLIVDGANRDYQLGSSLG